MRNLLVMVLLVGCGSSKFVAPEAPGTKVASKLARLTSSPSDAVFTKAVEHNTALAFGLYQQLKQPEHNLFYAPHSLEMALAMLYAGASGNTAKAFETTFGISSASDFHLSMNQLDRDLSSRGANSHGAAGEPFALNVVNQLFTQQNTDFAPAFLDVAATQYGASGRTLDFETKTEASRTAINDWVAASTNGHIKDFITPQQVSSDTKIVIANAMYFSAAWKTAFEPSQTKPGAFTTLDGSTVQTPLMHASAKVSTVTTDTFTALSMPYDGDELSFVAVMPKDFSAWESTLDGAQFTSALAQLSLPSTVDVTMPTFELQQRSDLIEPLKKVGLGAVFEGSDFTAMGLPDLQISFVTQQTWLKVSESGTQAAAATGIGGTRAASLPQQVVLDHPFIFAIRDDATGALLFVGRYVAPPSEK